MFVLRVMAPHYFIIAQHDGLEAGFLPPYEAKIAFHFIIAYRGAWQEFRNPLNINWLVHDSPFLEIFMTYNVSFNVFFVPKIQWGDSISIEKPGFSVLNPDL